jgi:hypothetical protein
MNDKNTGGSAFPFVDYDSHGDIMDIHSGMTLRDYFAAKAMQGLIAASGDAEGTVNYGDAAVAKCAYSMADAMLKARDA